MAKPEPQVFTRFVSIEPREGFRYNPMTGLYEETDDMLRKRIAKTMRSTLRRSLESGAPG